MEINFEKYGLKAHEIESALEKGAKFDALLADYEALKQQGKFKQIT